MPGEQSPEIGVFEHPRSGASLVIPGRRQQRRTTILEVLRQTGLTSCGSPTPATRPQSQRQVRVKVAFPEGEDGEAR